MLLLWYCLITTAVSASAAALAPRITYAFNVVDFQGHHLDLADGDSNNFTPVQSFKPAKTSNQEWALISSMDARQLWVISNTHSYTNLAHTTALLNTPLSAAHTQIVAGNKTVWWRMDGSKEGYRFTDADSGLALTAWASSGLSSSSPLTLEVADPKNKRQEFQLRCLRGWSIPSSC